MEESGEVEKPTEEKPVEEPSEASQGDTSDGGPKGLLRGGRIGERSKKFIFIVLALTAVSALIAGGILVSQRALKKAEDTEKAVVSPSPTPTEMPIPTSTPTPGLKREDLKIQVLNGRGEKGAAAAAAQLLKDKGYSEEIAAGNADRYDYEETIIKIKEDKQAYFSLLTSDLGDEYTVSTKSATLDKESEFDVIVIIGKASP